MDYQQIDEQLTEDINQTIDRLIMCDTRLEFIEILRRDDMIFLLQEDWIKELYGIKHDYLRK